MRYGSTVEYYAARKMDAMEVEVIAVSEVNPAQEEKCQQFSVLCGIWTLKSQYLPSINQLGP
jgi:hypothetical protein